MFHEDLITTLNLRPLFFANHNMFLPSPHVLRWKVRPYYIGASPKNIHALHPLTSYSSIPSSIHPSEENGLSGKPFVHQGADPPTSLSSQAPLRSSALSTPQHSAHTQHKTQIEIEAGGRTEGFECIKIIWRLADVFRFLSSSFLTFALLTATSRLASSLLHSSLFSLHESVHNRRFHRVVPILEISSVSSLEWEFWAFPPWCMIIAWGVLAWQEPLVTGSEGFRV